MSVLHRKLRSFLVFLNLVLFNFHRGFDNSCMECIACIFGTHLLLTLFNQCSQYFICFAYRIHLRLFAYRVQCCFMLVGFRQVEFQALFLTRNLWLCESCRSWCSSASVQDFATIAIALQMRSLDSVAYP